MVIAHRHWGGALGCDHGDLGQPAELRPYIPPDLYTPLRVLFGISALNFALRATVPLILGALSGILCERSGIINIGIEGMMLAGAFAAFVAKVATNGWPMLPSLLFGVVIALLVGGADGAVPRHCSRSAFAWIRSSLGTVIIILASGISAYLFDRDAIANGKFEALPIPGLSQIPVLGGVFFNNPPITYLALILVVVVHVALFYTRWGLRTRAVGEHPRAADTVGINVNRYRYVNTMLGGMLAGLAGAFLVLEAVGQFQEGMTAGRGFISLAAMIFGNWNPFGALGAAALFGYTQALQNELLLAGVVTVPRQFISMMPYVVTIVAVSGWWGVCVHRQQRAKSTRRRVGIKTIGDRVIDPKCQSPITQSIELFHRRSILVIHSFCPVFEARAITKRFPGVIANQNVNLKLHQGEILALLGENGAGKSTLDEYDLRAISPHRGRDSGQRQARTMNSPNDAIALGIGMVHQHFQLVPVMTVAENIMLGSETVRNGLLDTAIGSGAHPRSFLTATVLTWTPTPSSKICPWACASVWRSSKRSIATPTF